MKKEIDYSSRKVQILLFGFYSAIFIIAVRLFYLQIHKTEEFASRGEKNFLRLEVLEPLRGNIVDSTGKLLATNRPVFDIYWEGSGNYRLASHHHECIDIVCEVLCYSAEKKEALIKKLGRVERFSQRMKIDDDLSFEALCKISERCSNFSNLVIINHFKRLYPYQSLASHVLGYLGHHDGSGLQGRYGLEKLFQDELEGTTGYVVHVTNSTGKYLEEKEHKNAQAGNDIALTLDLDIQLIAENLFEKDQAGVFLLLDPTSGAIVSLVSYPNFDPNVFLESISQQEWDERFSQNSILLNRAVHALYPPASLFKLVTFAAGLENQVIEPDRFFTCRGYTTFYKRNYFCIRRTGHGRLSCPDLLAHSCNVPCYEIAKNLSIDTIADYAYRFGFGNSTGSILKDRDGLVPTSYWKMGHKGESWWRGETLSAAIGQSYLLVTPLQIARMICAICTGYLVRPRLLVSEDTLKEPLLIKKETLAFLRDGMRRAVLDGTAHRLRSLKDFVIYAKTGTAQTSSLELAKRDSRFLEHGWVAAYFYYKDQRPLVLLSLVERTGTSKPALVMARKFLEKYAQLQKKLS